MVIIWQLNFVFMHNESTQHHTSSQVLSLSQFQRSDSPLNYRLPGSSSKFRKLLNLVITKRPFKITRFCDSSCYLNNWFSQNTFRLASHETSVSCWCKSNIRKNWQECRPLPLSTAKAVQQQQKSLLGVEKICNAVLLLLYMKGIRHSHFLCLWFLLSLLLLLHPHCMYGITALLYHYFMNYVMFLTGNMQRSTWSSAWKLLSNFEIVA